LFPGLGTLVFFRGAKTTGKNHTQHNPNTLSGRTPQNKTVTFEGDADRLTGEIPDIRVEESTGFTAYGRQCWWQFDSY